MAEHAFIILSTCGCVFVYVCEPERGCPCVSVRVSTPLVAVYICLPRYGREQKGGLSDKKLEDEVGNDYVGNA